jgi:hypothetical protein
VADAVIAILLPTLKRFSCNGSMNPELSSKFTLSDHKTVSGFVKLTAKAHCAPVHGSIATKILYSWQQNGEIGFRSSVAELGKSSVAKSPYSLTHPVPSLQTDCGTHRASIAMENLVVSPGDMTAGVNLQPSILCRG